MKIIDNLKAYIGFVKDESSEQRGKESPLRIQAFTLGACIRDMIKPLLMSVLLCAIGVIVVCAFFASLYYIVVSKQHNKDIPQYVNYLKDSILIFFNLPIFTKENNPLFSDAFSMSAELVPTLSTIMMVEKFVGLFSSAVILAVITDTILHPINVLWALPKAVVVPGTNPDNRPSMRMIVRYWIRTRDGLYLNHPVLTIHFRESHARVASHANMYRSYSHTWYLTMARGIRTQEIELLSDEDDGLLLLELLSKSLAYQYRDLIIDEIAHNGMDVYVWNAETGCIENWNDKLCNYDAEVEDYRLYMDYKLDFLIAGTMPDGDDLQLRQQFELCDILLDYDNRNTLLNGKRIYTNILRVTRPGHADDPNSNTAKAILASEATVTVDDLRCFYSMIYEYYKWNINNHV